jgi:FkbM family methyltransferase
LTAVVRRVKKLVKDILKRLDIAVTSHTKIEKLVEESRSHHHLALLSKMNDDHISYFVKHLVGRSKAQLGQDLFVLSELNLKKNGFFVEFGATNGIDRSNTILLEKEFGWNGILAEPAKCWHSALKNNRTCHIETRCVWRSSGSLLTFSEAEWAELSTISAYKSSDYHKGYRKLSQTYDVETISLVDLLNNYNAPKDIDYISIDTEGSEFEILAAFDFEKYHFGVISCEHNFTPAREQIMKLLSSHGYIRKYEDVSLFDDWYVRA